MKTCKRLLLVITLICSWGALAAPYSIELNANYSDTDESDFEREDWSVGASYYFTPVDEATGPLAEAAFLSQSSSAGFAYLDTEEKGFPVEISRAAGAGWQSDLQPANSTWGNLNSTIRPSSSDVDGFALEGTYISRESGWVVGGAYRNTDGDGSPSSFQESETDFEGYRLFGGWYVTPSTRVLITYGEDELDEDLYFLPPVLRPGEGEFLVGIPLPGLQEGGKQRLNTSEVETSTWQVSTRHVGKAGEHGYAVEVSLATSDIDETLEDEGALFSAIGLPTGFDPGPRQFRENKSQWMGALQGTFYLTRELGLTLGYDHVDHDDYDVDSYRVGVEWFLVDWLAVEGGYQHSDRDDPLIDLDTWSIGIRGRY